ncbi:MAG: hypothetical protein JSS30_03245 [Verrucomicrobia bacterium]|nr:hypothetical protein [Verrucomicrobiota bacterium]
MTSADLEKIFNRSFSNCFSKKKLVLVFPVLVLCGLLAVICRTISFGSGQWMQMSMAFLPMFLCAGFLLALGLILVRIYHQEIKGGEVKVLTTIKECRDLIYGIPYLAVPIIFSYLVLWIVLGIFYLVRLIPHVGEVASAVFSFGPFLLVLGSLFLGCLSLLVLFYIAPAAALRSDLSPRLAEEVFAEIKANPFLSFIMPLFALLPLLLVIGILSLAAVVTHILYVEASDGLTLALKWFFIMIPFSAILAPAIIFFFNFAAESHVFLRKRIRQ